MHFRVIPNNRGNPPSPNGCSQTCEIRYRPHFVLISRSYQNPPSANDLLSKGYRFADIKASAYASHKTHACISLKQRSYSRNYGLVCNLGKQMAETKGFEPSNESPRYSLSRGAPSTTRPRLRRRVYLIYLYTDK